MPIEPSLDPSIVTFTRTLSEAEVDGLRMNEHIRVLQARDGVDESVWGTLNDRLFRHRPEVKLRRFGIEREPCDLSFLEVMTNVESLTVDAVRAVDNVDAVTRLPRLRALGVGIRELENFNFLEGVPSGLRALDLYESKSKRLDLGVLKRFGRLRSVCIQGHRTNLDVLGRLADLESVALISIRDLDLTFLMRLGRLRSLELVRASLWDLRSIRAHPAISRLALRFALGLADLSPISTLSQLQLLELTDLRRVEILPDLSGLQHLRRVCLDTLRGLRDVRSLGAAPSLEEFHFMASHLEPHDFLPLLRNPSLRRSTIGFGSDRKNREFDVLRNEHRIEEYRFTPFVFRDPTR